MFVVQFFKCSDDNRVVSKNLTAFPNNQYNNVIPKGELNIMKPQLIVKVDSANIGELMGFANYMYIPELSRYYYIQDKSLLTGNRISLTGSIDVLMTYAAGIRNLNGTITRQENIGINDIVDSLLPLQNRKELAVVEFESSEFNITGANGSSYNFVLNVSGGGSGQTEGGVK